MAITSRSLFLRSRRGGGLASFFAGDVAAAESTAADLIAVAGVSGRGGDMIAFESTADAFVAAGIVHVPPVAPIIGASASTISTLSIMISGGQGAASWVVQFKPIAAGSYINEATPIAVGDSAFVVDQALSPATAYNIRLVATNAYGTVYSNVLTMTTASAPAVVSAEADWLARIAASGVVWYHGFEMDAEADSFRWTGGVGNDPNATGNARSSLTRRITTDGPRGGCLEILRPAGTNENSHWWRPLSPIVGTGNGKRINDPGANGTIAAQAYAATQGGSQVANWGNKGWYGHSSYHTGSVFDGTEYYFQLRIKMDPRRTTNGNIQGGKLFYQSITPYSLSNQEIVTYSGAFQNPGSVGAPNIHRMYGMGTFTALEEGDSLNRPGIQVGSSLANYGASPPSYCQLSEDGLPGGSINTCWAYSGGWDTLLYHLIPGRDGVEETRIEVFAAHEGESVYTKIWDLIYPTVYDSLDQFGTPLPKGYNAIILSAYQNGLNNSEFSHRFADLIFSKSFIPCPAAAAPNPAWIDTAIANGWVLNTWATISGASPSHGLVPTNIANAVRPADAATRGNPAGVMSAWNGGAFARRAGAHGKMICWGGGHTDYQGTEVYGFDVSTRTWGLLSEPYTNVAWPLPGGWWPAHGAQVNGAPAPMHTYGLVAYHPARNSFYTFTAQTNNTPTLIAKVGEFDLNTNVWTPRSTSAWGIGGAGWNFYDSKRDRLVYHGDGGGSSKTVSYSAFDDSFNYYDQSNGAALGVTDNVAAYDPVNDIGIVLRRDNGQMLALQAGNLNADVTVLTDAGKPSISGGAGWQYCAELGGFVYYSSGTGVYLVTKGSGAWNAATWTWTLLTSGSNLVAPENTEGNPIYGRFQVARHGKYVVAYCVKRTGLTGSGAVYAFLLSKTAN